LEAFSYIKNWVSREISKERKVIFFDELPWFDTPYSDFLPALEHLWNSFLCNREDIILIVSGSATSWMLKNIIHNVGGLYNRLTSIINLKPFNLLECEEYFRFKGFPYSRYEICEIYMVFGGVPFYLNKLDPSLSFSQNIDYLFFGESAELKNEYKELLSSLFDNNKGHKRVLDTISQKKIGLSRKEIAEYAKLQENGRLTNILENLVSCGFIREYSSFNNKKKGSLYQLIDNFTLFYLEFRPDNNTLSNYFSSRYNNPSYNAWKGYAFEIVTLHHIESIKQRLRISSGSSNYSFKNEHSQIDLVIDRNDNAITLCEMKFYNDILTVSKDMYENKKNKINNFIEAYTIKKSIYFCLITTYGVKVNEYSRSINNILVLDDFFI
jgi:hypothetical protein